MKSIHPIRRLIRHLGIVSTGAPIPPERESLAIETIKKLGLEYVMPFRPSKFYANYEHGFANGSADERLDAVKKLLVDPEVDCILSARGATGSFDIIEGFPFSEFGSERKVLIGDSDVSSLLVQIPSRAGIYSIHGSTLGASFADYFSKSEAKSSVDQLISILSDPSYRASFTGTLIKQGVAMQGRFLAGNLSMLQSLLGTRWDVSYDSRFLLIEDVGESPYRVERALQQLHFAGKFQNLSGLVFGRFAKCESLHGPSIEEVIRKFVQKYLNERPFPVILSTTFGHWGENSPIPIGAEALYTYEGNQGTISQLHPIFEL